ncbi:MAG TPA: threonine/serine dehydratase [Gemmatimonadales bacterium]|nr:threonine/serine dehydratase [Gemmatimonadales bacterium]
MTSTADKQAAPRVRPEPGSTVSLQEMRAAAQALEGVAVRTPVRSLPSLRQITGVPVALKCEHLQPIGAFKIRGAYTAISRIPPEARGRGVITYSSGNHGQAVAFAARQLGVRAVVVMPQRAPAIKVEGVRRLGGEVVIEGNTSQERYERARQIALVEGLTIIPPFESLDVIAGQGTCGLEILEDAPDVEAILVPVGGGGLIAGIAAAVTAVRPEVEVVGVEPAGAPKLSRALEAGLPVALEQTESIADGLLPLSIGTIPFGILSGVVRTVIQVTEDEIVAGLRFLYREAGIAAEPSGAVTTAALLSQHYRPKGPTIAILSGGNIDPALLQRLVHPIEELSTGSRRAQGRVE